MGALITFLICLVLSTFSIQGLLANGPVDLSPFFVSENSSLSFDGPTIGIILTFNTSVDSSCFIEQSVILSNVVNFSSVCTFSSLQFSVETQTAPVHILMLSPLDSATIKSVIGNNPDVECLADFNSTFLVIFPVLLQPNQLNVIPDTSPPRLFSMEIDFQLGTLAFRFDEPIILESFNTSELSLLGTGLLQISNLTNAESSIETSFVSVSYTIQLEASEISLIHSVCVTFNPLVASCNLFRSFNFADDVINIIILNQFVLSDWGVDSISILVSPVGFKQANVSFSAPISLRQNDSVFYRVFSLPEKVEYYYGSCEQASGYQAQLDSQFSTLGLIFDGSLPCENTSEYLCVTTSSLSLTLDLILGADQYICVETVYTDLSIATNPCYFIPVSQWYRDNVLNLEIATNFGADSQFENSSLPFPIENRVLLTWNIYDLSFCDYHRMTVRYTQTPNSLYNIEVDTDTLCGAQFLYIYIPMIVDGISFSVTSEIRFISPSSIIPENTCRYTTISFRLFGQSFTNIIDIPVVESIDQQSPGNDIEIIWSSFSFTQMEHFNIYIFPVHALRHDNSSCNNLRADTRAEEFSLLPTEYYSHGVSIPGQIQFNLTCPPSPGSSLPYQCLSATSNDRSINVEIDYTYAVGVIVEAILLNQDTGVVTKVRSYPAIHSAVRIDLGESGVSYQQVSWNPDFCLFSSSIVFRIFFIPQIEVDRRSISELGIIPDMAFIDNKIFPCELTSAFLLDVPTSFNAYAYVFSETVTQDGAVCLSGFESNFERFGLGLEAFDRVVDFRYLDYNTVSLSIAVNGMFNQPATVYFLPFQVHRFELDSITDQCPSIVDDTDLTNSIPAVFENNSLVLSSFLPCENTSFYSCIFVDTTMNIVVDVIPGFDFAVRINSTSTVTTFGGNGNLELDDSTLLKRQTLLYTNTQLISNSSVIIEWDTAFYCPPDSYIYIKIQSWGLDFDLPTVTFLTTSEILRRRRREIGFDSRMVTLECGVGSYVIDNLPYSSTYSIEGRIFFNSTAFFPTCPTFQIQFDPVTTPDFFQEIKLVDFANVEVKWNLVPGVSNYTLMAVPTGVLTFSDQINSVYSTSFVERFTDYTETVFTMEVLYRYCFELNITLTCSRLETTSNSAVLSIIPGYEYDIVIVYEQDGDNIFELYPDFFCPADFVDISISDFDLSYFFQYDSQVCINNTRTVFYFLDGGEPDGLFRVDSCFNSSAELSRNVSSIPQVLFILPYLPIQFPDLSISPVNPTHIALLSSGTPSSLPLSAAPVITTLQSPADSSVDLYQAEWKSLHSFSISQQFESYTLYAIPSSREFSLSDQECPEYIYPGCFLSRPISPLTTRSLLTDICPSKGINYYFCKEFSALEGDINLFPLLDYDIFVEAVYDGGLRAYRQQAGVNVTASQTLLEILNLTYTVTESSIDIYWDTTSVFCVDSTIAFLYSTQIDYSLVVDCQLGFYSIGSLRSRTEYEVYIYFNYNPTRLYPESQQCIKSNPQIAFTPSPVTASFCLTQQPCQGLGMCSEGISTGSYLCDCLAGYEFNGITCVDINECSSPISPCVNSACVNSIGSYTCVCFNGFVSVNGDCVDINECNLPGYCVNGICTNLLPPENYRCDCEDSYTGSTCNISTLTTPLCAAITESNQFGIDLTFPATPVGSDGNIACSQLDNTLFGMISKPCSSAGVREDTDFQNCLSASFVTFQGSAAPLTGGESVLQSQQLVSATSGGFLYPGEVGLAAAGLEGIRDSLLNLTGDELTDTLSQVIDSVVRIASNVFSSENRISFSEMPVQEAESEISSIVSTVESLGLLIGSIIPVNSTVVIEERNAALVVVVVSNNTEGIFIGPSSVSDQSALSRGRASVSIPASVLQAIDVGEGVEVSFSVFPSLSQLLEEVEAEVPRSDRETSVNDSIATAVINLNIFTRGVGRVEQLNGEILLSFGLLFDPPVIQNDIKFAIAYTCVSTQSIEDDWVANGTVLANSPQVPPGPAQCSVTHLTNFAVLVSALSLNLTPQERLGIEILSYTLGSISILFLSLSLVSYFILWLRTRKQKTSLFKKDATILHCNFAVALLIALVFFLASGGAYSNRQACLAVTIVQYYFWLSVFTASFCIGLYLLIKIFAWGVERRFWHFLVALSWGLPIPLLIITPAITHEYIIDDIDEICWLSNEPTFVSLAFIIPMAVMTLLNVVALILTAIVLFKVSRGKGNVFAQLRGVLLASFILAPLLGLPWLFSIFATIPSPATAFIFTIVLGLQGVVFAVLYPLRTPEIVMYVFKWKPVHSSISFASNTGSNPSSSKPLPSLKFRINRRGDSENTSVNPTLETKNEYLGIRLEPVTVENSLRLVQNQKKTDIESNLQVIQNPRYDTSISVPGEDTTSSHSIKVPYESLPIHHDDNQ